ncbi:fimbrial biogenesis chaperone [Novosphingobium barchaimii]|nr:hypothetical protein [Novosphingobium barchaimii]
MLGPLAAVPARAGIALSKVIVDLAPDAPPRDDIEVINDGNERQYVVAEPALIQAAGTAQEKRIDSSDPMVTGLLVTPQKLVLEAGERKLIRVALIAPRGANERVFRVAIKPVAGTVEAEQTSLKVFVGYDVLVIARATSVAGKVVAARSSNAITFHNRSNASVEMSDGHQCDEGRKNCLPLPAMRLYSGADWTVPIKQAALVEYRMQQGKLSSTESF